MARTLIKTKRASGQSSARQPAATPALSWVVGSVLMVLVVLTHAWLVNVVGEGLAQMAAEPATPPRVQVRYVRDMALAAPAEIAPTKRPPAPKKPPQPTGAPLPRLLPQAAAPQPDETSTDAASQAAPEAVAQAASAADAPAEAPLVPQSADVAAPHTPTNTKLAEAPPNTNLTEQTIDSVWPQTTRVSYSAQGYYNGEFYGNATVEWVRQGDRYQMHMDVSLGLGIYKRMATSRGRISDQGARPEQFDETVHRLFAKPRQSTVLLGEQQIEFAQGNKVDRPAGVQDTTSQFVQLTYLFATRPELTEPGQRIEFPLAFHRNLRAYAYQVQARQVLQTVLGPLDTVHVVPRRVDPKDNDLVAQLWFAPALKYLPARIRFNQGEDIYIELNISKAPELAR
ncbi:MAG: hypothetical protein RIS44_886 [Pseudomonadota bacterium]|jgi:hypothetical protein